MTDEISLPSSPYQKLPSQRTYSQASTMAVHLSTISVSNYVSFKLCGDKKSNNYSTWKRQMLCLIESQDLLRFINGEIQLSKEDYTWRTDRQVMGWILGALDEAVLKTLVNFSTATDVWLELENMFSDPLQPQPQLAEWPRHLPLYRATLKGDWDKAKAILEQDRSAMEAKLNPTLQTALHVAVGTGTAIDFVRKLVDLMAPENLLGLKDNLGCTALHIAAQTGNKEAAETLIGKNSDLLYEANNAGELPVHVSALSADGGTLRYFIEETNRYDARNRDDARPNPYLGENGVKLLCNAIDYEMFDAALALAEKYPDLAKAKLKDGNSALKRIALNVESLFSILIDELLTLMKTYEASEITKIEDWTNNIEDPIHPGSSKHLQEPEATSLPGPQAPPRSPPPEIQGKMIDMADIRNIEDSISDIEDPVHPGSRKHPLEPEATSLSEPQTPPKSPSPEIQGKRKMMSRRAIELVKCLCKNMESLDYWTASAIYEDAILTGARSGNDEIIQEIVDTFPASIYTPDIHTKQSIFHVAAENRHQNVFRLISHNKNLRHQISDMRDSSGNTFFHSAARLASPQRLNLVVGAAFQLQYELLWFEEIERFVPRHLREAVNHAGKTASMVFAEEHAELRAAGERWEKDIANACSIVAALIATITFAAAITVPGGMNSNQNGSPLFFHRIAFHAFTSLNIISFFTSITCLFLFLSTVTSRHAEKDFRKRVPRKLKLILLNLLISIMSMMGAFVAAIYLLLLNNRNAVIVFSVLLVFAAVYPLWLFQVELRPLTDALREMRRITKKGWQSHRFAERNVSD